MKRSEALKLIRNILNGEDSYVESNEILTELELHMQPKPHYKKLSKDVTWMVEGWEPENE
jgi:hypothetical protein